MIARSADEVVTQRVAEEGAAVRAAVLAALPPADGDDHLYALLADYVRRPGRTMRPLLCLAACRINGGATCDAMGLAVAIELLHHGFLIHDDIEDGSTRRRGGPALHVRHGVPLALNAGDGLLALAVTTAANACSRLNRTVGRPVLHEFTFLLRRTVEGQGVELGWIADGRLDVTEADYLAMVMSKTCWYSTISPLRIGALLGSGGAADIDALTAFGFYLGATFQIADDLDNLLGARVGGASVDGEYGKDAGGDVIEGKRTLMLMHLLAHASPADRVRAVASIGPVAEGSTGERVSCILDLMDRYGSIDHAMAYRQALAGAALAQLRALFSGHHEDSDVAFLAALALHLAGAGEALDG